MKHKDTYLNRTSLQHIQLRDRETGPFIMSEGFVHETILLGLLFRCVFSSTVPPIIMSNREYMASGWIK